MTQFPLLGFIYLAKVPHSWPCKELVVNKLPFEGMMCASESLEVVVLCTIVYFPEMPLFKKKKKKSKY